MYLLQKKNSRVKIILWPETEIRLIINAGYCTSKTFFCQKLFAYNTIRVGLYVRPNIHIYRVFKRNYRVLWGLIVGGQIIAASRVV